MIVYPFVKQLNSLTKDNFIRLNLLEAHNSLFNYDIISLCETSKLTLLRTTLFDCIYLKHIILCSTMILYPFVKQLNSLTKDNFIRLNLLAAHNSLFNYDIISLCETTKLPY